MKTAKNEIKGQNLIILRNIEPLTIVGSRILPREDFDFVCRREEFFLVGNNYVPDSSMDYLAILYQLTHTMRLLRNSQNVLVSAPFKDITVDLLKYATNARKFINPNISIKVIEGPDVIPILPMTAKEHGMGIVMPWHLAQKYIKP